MKRFFTRNYKEIYENDKREEDILVDARNSTKFLKKNQKANH